MSWTRHLRWLLAVGVVAAVGAGAPLLSALAGTAPKSFGDARAAAALPFMTCDTLILDFNGDGRPEFAGGNHFAPGFGIAVNSTPRAGAEPAFSRVVNVQLPDDAGRSAGLYAADVNADGRPDLASSNHRGTLSVVVNATARGSQAISFSRATTVELGAGPQIGAEGSGGGVVAADFDLDGRPDFATANFGNGTAAVVRNLTARGARTARLGAPVRFGVGGRPIAIAAGDLDGDRRPDIVTSNLQAGTVSVLLNRTTRGQAPRFAKRRDVRVGAGPTFSALADFNADGRLDIVSSNWTDRTVTVVGNYTRRGSGDLRLRVDTTVPLRTHGLIVRAADLDGDRRPDLAVFPFDPPAQMAAIMIGNRTSKPGARPRFGRPESYTLPANLDRSRKHYAATGAVGDLNGDGALEMAAGVVDARFAPVLGDDFYKFISDPALASPPAELLPRAADIVVLANGD